MKLFVDSSTNYLYIGLIKDNKEYSITKLGKMDHSEMMVKTIEEFFNNLNININDVKDIYIGRGPGSYTGLRISGTFGKTLSLIKDIKLYSFSSLDLLLSNYFQKDGKYLAKIKAKKDHSYYKTLIVKNNQFTLSEEKFGNDSELLIYQDYIIISPSDMTINFEQLMALSNEENNLDYTPNYMRSEFN